MEDWADIACFIERHAESLKWIVRDSQGMWAQEDLAGEIFVAAHAIAEKAGHPPDLLADGDAAMVLRHLRRMADRNGRPLRNAARLDVAIPDRPSLFDRIPANGGEHPLSLLEAAEVPEYEPEMPDPYHSEAVAWHWLVLGFNRRMADVADYLLISTSWCHSRRRRARRRMESQFPLPHGLEVGIANTTALKPWRHFKLPPRTKADAGQLGFDYWNRPLQPGRGQLWLL